MKIYIDCEWNDYKGDLISMALCAEDGKEFYEVVPCPNPTGWVEKNVIPKLNKKPIGYVQFQRRLASFLLQYDAVEIVADWPEDIAHFCEALIIGPGRRLEYPPTTMIFKCIDSGSAIPHNALFDARGIRDADMPANAPGVMRLSERGRRPRFDGCINALFDVASWRTRSRITPGAFAAAKRRRTPKLSCRRSA